MSDTPKQLDFDFTAVPAGNLPDNTAVETVAFGIQSGVNELIHPSDTFQDEIYCPGCGREGFNGHCPECGTFEDDLDSQSGSFAAQALFNSRFCEKCGQHFFGTSCDCGNRNTPIYGNFLPIGNQTGLVISYRNFPQKISSNHAEIEFKIDFPVYATYPKMKKILQTRYFKIGFQIKPKYRKFFDGTAEGNEVFDGYDVQVTKIYARAKGQEFRECNTTDILLQVYSKSILPTFQQTAQEIIKERLS